MIALRNVLLLTTAEAFLFGVACILGAIWFALVMVRRLPLLLRDLLTLFRGALAADEESKVVQIEEHRRRTELNAAAAGKRAS